MTRDTEDESAATVRGSDAPTLTLPVVPGAPDVPGDTEELEQHPPRPLPAAVAVLVGVVGALLGLAPWIVTSMRLPLHDIWQAAAGREDMPLALLPLNQYHLVAAVAMVVVGSALAGAVVRLAAQFGRPLRAWPVVAGAVVVQGIALAQTGWVLINGLEDSTRGRVYLLGMIAGVGMGIVVGLLVTLGIGRAGVAARTIAITVTALALSQWLPTLIHPIGAMPRYDAPRLVSTAALWLPFVVVGLAVGWCGVASVRRAAASVVSLLSLWVGSATIVAFTYAVGSRIYLQHPSELIPAGMQAFREGLTSFGLPRQMVLTVVIALVVALTLSGLRRIDRAGSDARR